MARDGVRLAVLAASESMLGRNHADDAGESNQQARRPPPSSWCSGQKDRGPWNRLAHWVQAARNELHAVVPIQGPWGPRAGALLKEGPGLGLLVRPAHHD